MKLKLDENGVAVLHEGMPVYTHDDGKEIPFDGAMAFSKIAELQGEIKQVRERGDNLVVQLKQFDGLDAKTAREAVELAKNIKDGELLKADQVAQLKASIAKSYEDAGAAKENSYQAKITELSETLTAKEQAIHRLLIKGAFDSSPFLKEKTVLIPDIAFTYFGGNFTVETVNGELTAVAVKDGQPLLSRVRPGQHATAEEAIELLIDSHPQKDAILKAPPAKGGGAGPSRSPGTPGAKTWQEEHAAALARGDVKAAVAIKNRAYASKP